MPCKQYKDALIEAATSGLEPQGDLRSHLARCADCRAAFEQERSLFASIDAGLQVAVNAEVPVSLLPRVRARLDEESAPRRIWAANWLVLASAAVLVVGFFAVRAFLRSSVVQQPVESVHKPVVPPLVTPPPQNHGSALVAPAEKNSAPQRQEVVAKVPPQPSAQAKGNTALQVLVPRDQELLLAEYAEQWGRRKHPVLVTQNFDATVLSPLQVAPIQIDELGVKLLAEEKMQ
jgi:hypothetical protein